MILHDRTKAAQIFVLCRVHLRACFVHSLLSAATIESLEQGNVSEMHTTILTCSRGIYNVTSVRVQGYVGAFARQNTHSTTAQYMMYRRKAVATVPFFGVWTPNSELSYVLNDCGLRLQRSQPFSRSCSAFWERRLTSLILETSASWFITR